MYKIAISGKANSGKNTVANLIINHLDKNARCATLAFADPIKEIIKIMFPHVKKRHLYGSSKYRNTIIEGAVDKSGNPLTIRQALIEIGTGMGRGMNSFVWLDVFEHRFAKLAKRNDVIIVTDARFPNEISHLKKSGFVLLRVSRKTDTVINHSSETEQDNIKDSDFDIIIDNNGTLESLTNIIITQVCPLIKSLHGISYV